MEQTAKTDKMGQMPVNKLMLAMGLPMIISMVLQALYNIVDSAFISNMAEDGEAALTALTLAFPMQMLMVAIGIGTGVGTNALLAKSLGQGNKEKASKVAGNSQFLALVIYIAFLVFGIFGVRFYISTQTVNALIYNMAVDYLTICCIVSPGIVFFSVYEKLLQACGHSMFSTIAQIAGAVTNIILDPIFIFGFNMGVQGAAVATVLSQALSAVWALKFLCGKKTILRIKKKNLKIKASVFLPCAALGIAPFAMQATESVLVLCFNSSLLKYGGDLAVGAMTILSSIMQFAMLPLQGITQGGQPIISYNYGAKKIDRIKQAFKLQTISCVVYATIIWLIAEFAPSIFVSIFTSDTQLAELSQWALRIYLACIFLMGVQVSCQQTFIAFGNSKISAFLAVFRKILVLIPLIYILPVFMEDNVKAVFLAEPIADAIAILTTATLFYINFKKIIKSESQV